jgi:hypothetical protein
MAMRRERDSQLRLLRRSSAYIDEVGVQRGFATAETDAEASFSV